MSTSTKVAKVGDLPPGEFMLVETEEVSAVLFNIDGAFFAIGAKCTHREGDLVDGKLDGTCIVCPLHGARFDVRTGVKEGGKPDQNVNSFPITVQGDDIFLSSD